MKKRLVSCFLFGTIFLIFSIMVNSQINAEQIILNFDSPENSSPFANTLIPKCDGNDIIVPDILIKAIPGFNPMRPVYAACDENGWLCSGGDRVNDYVLSKTKMIKEGNYWRAENMAGERFHPVQIKNTHLPNPYIGNNISWAKIENVYPKWSTEPFVDMSGSGPCLELQCY